jgi:hypothetical protein
MYSTTGIWMVNKTKKKLTARMAERPSSEAGNRLANQTFPDPYRTRIFINVFIKATHSTLS